MIFIKRIVVIIY